MSDEFVPKEIESAAWNHGLLAYLRSHVPPERWGQPYMTSSSLLHVAARGGDHVAVAALIAHGLAINAKDNAESTPAHKAACNGHVRCLEVLVACGASFNDADDDGNTLLECAIANQRNATASLLVANGARLASVREPLRVSIDSSLRLVEAGRIKCRAAVCALIASKKKPMRSRALPTMDRFVVREIALALWATRAEKVWQTREEKCCVM